MNTALLLAVYFAAVVSIGSLGALTVALLLEWRSEINWRKRMLNIYGKAPTRPTPLKAVLFQKRPYEY